jgi:hypothetical protein
MNNFFNKSLKIKWLISKFKVLRNQLFLEIYLTKKPCAYNPFINSVRFLKGSNIAIVVAFEQPWALDWLLKMAKKNLQNTTVLVFDNSRDFDIRSKIKSACRKNKAHYLSLPKYSTNHVNRSHGMAMSWIYKHIVEVIQPKLFAFIDHDLIPVRSISFAKLVKIQPFYGRETGKKKIGFWSLWAGYCVFDFNYLVNKKINFLYDFSRGLDTGGRNWKALYSNYKKETLAFASSTNKKIFLPNFKQGFSVEFIDDKWIHIGGISYNNNFEKKFMLFKALAKEIDINPLLYRSVKMESL